MEESVPTKGFRTGFSAKECLKNGVMIVGIWDEIRRENVLKRMSPGLDGLIKVMFFLLGNFKCQGMAEFSVNLNSITWRALIVD